MKTITITKFFPKQKGKTAGQLLKSARSMVVSIEKDDARLKGYNLCDIGFMDKGNVFEMNFYYAQN